MADAADCPPPKARPEARRMAGPLTHNPPMHLLIPFAHCQSPLGQAALQSLALPHLAQLLQSLTLTATDLGDESSLSPPHERALALAHGLATPGKALTDGQVPWGAWHAAYAGLLLAGAPQESPTGWAVITPAQWAVQTNHITMSDPEALRITETDSRALLAAMEPYFSGDGIRLIYNAPTRWLACGAVFHGLATASVDRVVGRHVDDWLPKSDAAKPLRRLQQEMQMLLYTHPLTEARAAKGLPAVNSFWVSGTGPAPVSLPQGPVSALVCPNTLRDAAVREDWAAWVEAWRHIDAAHCTDALRALAKGEPVTLTLCGEKNSQRFESRPLGPLDRLIRKLKSISGQKPLQILLSQL